MSESNKVISFELVPINAKYVGRAAEVLTESRLAKFSKVLRFSYPQDSSFVRVELTLAKDKDVVKVESALMSLTNSLKQYGVALKYKEASIAKYDAREEIMDAVRSIANGDIDYGSEVLTFISEANIDTSVQLQLQGENVQLTVSEAAGAILDAVREVTAGIKIQ